MPDEQTHDEREQRRDDRGRDRVRVEDLEQLNVRRDDGDEVAAVAPLELRGAETAQCAEDLVADQRKQLEGDEVVAGLLGVLCVMLPAYSAASSAVTALIIAMFAHSEHHCSAMLPAIYFLLSGTAPMSRLLIIIRKSPAFRWSFS